MVLQQSGDRTGGLVCAFDFDVVKAGHGVAQGNRMYGYGGVTCVCLFMTGGGFGNGDK